MENGKKKKNLEWSSVGEADMSTGRKSLSQTSNERRANFQVT